MLKLAKSLLCSALFFTSWNSIAVAASAERYPESFKRYLVNELDNSVKCEVGTYALSLRRKGIPSAYKNGAVEVTAATTITEGTSIGVLISSIVANLFKGSGTFTITEGNTITRVHDFNLHPANASLCKLPHVRPQVGVLSCLQDIGIDTFKHVSWDKLKSSSCDKDVTMKVEGSGNLGFPILVVTFGPTFDLSASAEMKVTVTVPPPKGNSR